jgi:hypothetical protein
VANNLADFKHLVAIKGEIRAEMKIYQERKEACIRDMEAKQEML